MFQNLQFHKTALPTRAPAAKDLEIQKVLKDFFATSNVSFSFNDDNPKAMRNRILTNARALGLKVSTQLEGAHTIWVCKKS